jgi:SAM-dependent methyltransferase
MSGSRLPSIEYEPPGQPSLYDRWEVEGNATMQAPLAVRDPEYRADLLRIFEGLPALGRRLIGIGSGNGHVEAELAAAGWDVLATDPCTSALRHCADKGLATARLALGEDLNGDRFDVSYSDGVMGHLWEPEQGTSHAWQSLAQLGVPGSFHVTSNDLSDDDRHARFAVNVSSRAAFYRPPAGTFEREATEGGRWTGVSTFIYPYLRRGVEPRRREILVLKLLLDERVEAEDLS